MNNHDHNDPFYKLIEKQTKEFEEYIRVSLDLQTTYKEYLVQQNESKQNNSMDTLVEIKKIYERYDEKIDTQSKLIDSLKARIEELETDSIIKNQDIKKLQQEFIDFKNRDKKSNTLSKNEKENEDLKTVKTLIDTNISNPQNFEDVQEMFKQLKSYHRALIIAERKNLARNERIQALEGLLKDSQNQLVTQSQ
ncbi:2067_t:CDS:1, partial [Funneliformis caledonium]